MSIWVIGDLHGSTSPVEHFYQKNKELLDGEQNILICLGDVGTNYYLNGRDKSMKKKLSKLPFTYFMIRGNHEERAEIVMRNNPQDWHEEIFFNNKVLVENDFPNIKYALDCATVYNVEGLRTLVIPGAYSVDKYYRLVMGWNWFEHEQLSSSEMEDCTTMLNHQHWNVDVVLSHTCPSVFIPTDLFLSTVDQSTVDNSMERYLGEVEFKLNYKAWMWGHYHAFRDYPRTDGKKKLMLFNEEVVNLKDYVQNEQYQIYK